MQPPVVGQRAGRTEAELPERPGAEGDRAIKQSGGF
ncbi:MAG: hypothetical protein KatS3mg108_0179 [Isosphaeraceae bacterium]|nr:MAG: hypothetical protein KatS3mg108_0179 [Isosphaeraceae bacterium]